MGSFPDAPAVVLVAITLAAALLMVEIALPTLGTAGLSSLGLAALAVSITSGEDHPWWPLLLVAAAVCMFAVLLAGQWASPTYQLVAAGMFAAGGVGYGLLARDPATVAIGAVGAVALPSTFRPLLRAAGRLRALPPQTGMGALVGRTGTVVTWSGGSGTVRVDGSLWNATASGAMAPDVAVVVEGFTGMTVLVALRATVP